jgi:hypothetical protein
VREIDQLAPELRREVKGHEKRKDARSEDGREEKGDQQKHQIFKNR